MITIEPSKASHVDAIERIEKMCFAVPWSKASLYRDIVQNVLAYYVSAMENGSIPVGYGGMWTVEDEAHVTNIAVHPSYRHRGIGNQILLTLIERCRFEAKCRMSLEVRVGNFPAIELYRKHGFKPEGIRKGYYSDNGEDAYVMWKYL